MLSLNDIESQAETLLAAADDGSPLDAVSRSLIALAVAASVTSLNGEAIREALAAAKAAGATTDQVQEIISLVSGLGVHTLMMTAALISDGDATVDSLDEERRRLWDRHVGDNPYWLGFEAAFPGFLLALLTVSPAGFDGFFSYCAIPWATRSVRAIVKELAAMACDATPTHRFGPGFRLHLSNALLLGAGKLAVRETLAIARDAPGHIGVA